MFCAYTGPRYQVSVYRTIGPLVCVFRGKILVEYMYCLPRLTLSLWKNVTPRALRDLIAYIAPPAPGLSYITIIDKINIY